MEHFLIKMINNPEKDLSKDNTVHKRFVRFSRGIFQGPALKIDKTTKKITIRGSTDYEDILSHLVLKAMPFDKVTVSGKIFAFDDPNFILQEKINPEIIEKMSITRKKNKGWIIVIEDTISREDLSNIYSEFNQLRGYVLLKLSVEDTKDFSFTVKQKIPENKGEYEYDRAIKFCTARMSNTKENESEVLDALLPDFKDEIKQKYKTIKLENNYNIEDIEIPDDAKTNKRLAAIRKGVLIRNINVFSSKKTDNEILKAEKQVKFIV
ncbi:MAG: hypothetical protein ACTSXP_02205 [Promethearchaeota archaeon]